MTQQIVPLFTRAIASGLGYGAPFDEFIDIALPLTTKFQQLSFASLREAQASSYQIRNPSFLLVRELAENLIKHKSPTGEQLHRQSRLLQCNHAWFQALRELENITSLSREDQILASELKAAYYTIYILSACSTEVSQTQYDAHIPLFKALVHHAQIVLDSLDLPRPSVPTTPQNAPSPQVTANFTFELSIILPLFFVATRCRCPTLRREALSLLKTNPPREGLWHAEQLAVVAQRVIQIEERNVDPQTGWPVEENRLWCSVVDGNMDRNGGFWVTFAVSEWVKQGGQFERGDGRRRRLDAQWDEWLIV